MTWLIIMLILVWTSPVYIRVVDVGAGLYTVTKVPGDHYMVYDSGHWQGWGKSRLKAPNGVSWGC